MGQIVLKAGVPTGEAFRPQSGIMFIVAALPVGSTDTFPTSVTLQVRFYNPDTEVYSQWSDTDISLTSSDPTDVPYVSEDAEYRVTATSAGAEVFVGRVGGGIPQASFKPGV